MATKIGSLFGDITLNTKQLDKDIRKANRKLKAFGRSATQAGKSMALGFGTPVAVFGGTQRTFHLLVPANLDHFRES